MKSFSIALLAGALIALAAAPVSLGQAPGSAPSSVELSPIDAAIRDRVDALRSGADQTVRGEQIVLGDVVGQLFEARAFRSAWSRPERVDELVAALEGLVDDGLDPADYHVAALRSLRDEARARTLSADERADLELLATDAMALGLYQLYAGKVDPERLDPNWNIAERPIRAQNAYQFLGRVLDGGGIAAAFEDVRPQHAWYRALREQLRRYRALVAAGGWPTPGAGPVLKLGMADPGVPALRQRLRASGDYTGPDSAAEQYDAAMAAAVRRYQLRNGRTADGVLGVATRAALNVTAAQRVDQLRVNLERGRWVLHELEGDFVLVDIAGFTVRLIRNGQPAWESRIVVGKPYRSTPVFKSRITYVVLNPTWTVPPTILANDILPAVKRNPAYLSSKRIRVIDGSGREVDPLTIDWQQYKRRIPYELRQDPGPDNALGLVKIMFPNPHHVYLHDSPAKSLYERESRTFSSGCIRVQKAFELTELVLDDPQNWNRAAIDTAIAAGKTQTITLKKPLAVLILYWTARPLADGEVQFRPDVYGRDAPTLRALDSRYGVRTPAALSQSANGSQQTPER